jgi:hypothetical protein
MYLPHLVIALTLLLLLPTLTLAQFDFFPFGQNPFGGGQPQQEQQQSSGWRAHKGWAEYEGGASRLPRAVKSREEKLMKSGAQCIVERDMSVRRVWLVCPRQRIVLVHTRESPSSLSQQAVETV